MKKHTHSLEKFEYLEAISDLELNIPGCKDIRKVYWNTPRPRIEDASEYFGRGIEESCYYKYSQTIFEAMIDEVRLYLYHPPGSPDRDIINKLQKKKAFSGGLTKKEDVILAGLQIKYYHHYDPSLLTEDRNKEIRYILTKLKLKTLLLLMEYNMDSNLSTVIDEKIGIEISCHIYNESKKCEKHGNLNVIPVSKVLDIIEKRITRNQNSIFPNK